jgi:hypothetical protein
MGDSLSSEGKKKLYSNFPVDAGWHRHILGKLWWVNLLAENWASSGIMPKMNRSLPTDYIVQNF